MADQTQNDPKPRQAGDRSLWKDVQPMIDLSDLAYEVVAIRQAARDGKIDAPAILETPFDLGVVLDIVRRNEELIKELRNNEENAVGFGGSISSVKSKLTALQRYIIRKDERKEAIIKMDDMIKQRAEDVGYGRDGIMSGVTTDDVVFLEVGDENHANGGVVYLIAVNHAFKRLAVSFRGSATLADFQTDLTLNLKTIENPLYGLYDVPLTMKVHAGIFDYLEGKPKSNNINEDEESGRQQMFDLIFRRVISFLNEYEGYRFYVAGHSLGGGLATMFAFYATSKAAAAEAAPSRNSCSILPKPIVCINIGSPMVGNTEFRRSFEALEHDGRIQQLRIVNALDPIPRMPLWDVCGRDCACYRQSNAYRHVGIRLMIFGSKPPRSIRLTRCINPFYLFGYCMFLCSHGYRPAYHVSYQTMPTPLRLFCVDVSQFIKYWVLFGFLCWGGPESVRFHSTLEYWDRTENIRNFLEDLTLSELYNEAMQEGGRQTLAIG